MNLKKIFMYLIIIIIIIIVLLVGYFIYISPKKDKNEITEIVPQEELSDEKLRQTIVTLYFLEIDTGKLYPEARQIDAKLLLENPYKVLMELLIEGPRNEKLIKLIPEGSTIRDIEKQGNMLIINFSENFIKDQNLGKEQEKLIVDSVVKTITELTEVEKVLIKIEGEENCSFPDGGVDFKSSFSREKDIISDF